MDAVRLHLVFNHAPIFWIGLGLLLFLFGLFRKNRSLIGAGLFSFVLAGIAVIFVYLSGHNAEELVEHLPGISEAYLEKHEEAAEVAFYTTLLLGISAFITFFLLFFRRVEDLIYKIFLGITFVLALGSIGALANAGSHGGKIRHTELISGQQGQVQMEEGEEHGEDEEEEEH